MTKMAFHILFILVISLAILEGISAAETEKQGRLTLFGSHMPGQTDPDIATGQTGGLVDLELTHFLSEDYSFKIQPWYKFDSLNKSAEEKSQFELLEAHFSIKKNSKNVKLGLSTVNWEGTDFLNPMDMLNAKSYRDPMNIMNRSSGMLALGAEGESWGIEAVYIPWRSEDLLPGNESPWWPRHLALPTENEGTKLLIPDQMRYFINDHQRLNQALKDNAGLKIQYRGDQWDFSVAVSEGASSPLTLHPIANATAIIVDPARVILLKTPVYIQPIYYRQRAMAFAFTRAWETFIFRMSAQHSQPLGDDVTLTAQAQSGVRNINVKLPSWSQFGVVELEKHFSIFETDLAVILEYAENKKPNSNSVTSFSAALQNVYLLGFRWPFRETWTTNAAFFQDYKTKANYAHASLAKTWNDHLSSELSLDVFSGGDESLLGVYDKNDQVHFKTTFAF